ncbi:DNA recombination protein RecO [Porphyrobacter algicida]|uniref:DNA recombination protein RecO n=1 Tax=Qipengyuania algicida TaxID=1836209 RepID=A0A845AJ25_9SPHN|nr:DNA repair protein RecO C-terminal domain-containing protein [Qipengyuania algicida]MXP28855.1 DNA recombination protein RecO [Qipengyuania algicida]
MQLAAPAIFVAARAHGETAVIARLLTEEAGLVAAYVAGGRGRILRPVVIPGNVVAADIRAKSDSQLPFARLELVESRGPWMTEPLPASAIAWVCALTAATLPERHPYPALYQALGALLDAICHAPSARGWTGALVAYEVLLLRELGYGGGEVPPRIDNVAEALVWLDRLEATLATRLLAHLRGDVMGARTMLRERLGKMVTST